MVELTPSEEAALKELVDVHMQGGDVGAFANGRLRSLLDCGPVDAEGNFDIVQKPGYSELRQDYEGLCRLGLLEGRPPDHPKRFGDLTSQGRGYFEIKDRTAKAKAAELEESRKAKAAELDESRRYARKQAVIAFAASTAVTLAVTLLVNARGIYENVMWLLSFTVQ